MSDDCYPFHQDSVLEVEYEIRGNKANLPGTKIENEKNLNFSKLTLFEIH